TAEDLRASPARPPRPTEQGPKASGAFAVTVVGGAELLAHHRFFMRHTDEVHQPQGDGTAQPGDPIMDQQLLGQKQAPDHLAEIQIRKKAGQCSRCPTEEPALSGGRDENRLLAATRAKCTLAAHRLTV
ncbi:MAG: hypothetical protein AAGG72_10815, partial [Pseudomonadota bacterium]